MFSEITGNLKVIARDFSQSLPFQVFSFLWQTLDRNAAK